jgi:hypothetical protein
LLNLVSDSQFSTNPIKRPGTEFFQFRKVSNINKFFRT